jgi:hypothetical protein
MHRPDPPALHPPPWTSHPTRASALERARLAPALPERADADRGRALDVLAVQELVLAPEREEVREQAVQVWLGPQVEDVRVVRVVDVREHAQQLPVHVLHRRREVCGELGACGGRARVPPECAAECADLCGMR